MLTPAGRAQKHSHSGWETARLQSLPSGLSSFSVALSLSDNSRYHGDLPCEGKLKPYGCLSSKQADSGGLNSRRYLQRDYKQAQLELMVLFAVLILALC